MRKILIFFVFWGVSPLVAHIHPERGSWGFTGELLYLLPSVDDTYFVLDGEVSGFPNGTRTNNDFDFNTGFRIAGVYGLCDGNRGFEGAYARLNAQQPKTVTGAFLSSTVGTPEYASSLGIYSGSAHSNLSLLYQRADAFYSQQLFPGCDSTNFYLLAGLEYDSARLSENFTNTTNTGTVGTIQQRGETWGIGPQCGFDFDYIFCKTSSFCSPGGLSLKSRGTMSVLASKTTFNAEDILSGTTLLDFEDNSTWRLIPALHARVGLNYTGCFVCYRASLEVGYEFNTYLRSLARVIFPSSVATGLAFTEYYNFDIQGFYFSASMAF